MAITQQAGDPTTWPATVEMREGGDGVAGFWANTAKQWTDRGAFLYDKLVDPNNGFIAKLASQAVGTFGTYLVGQRAITDSAQGNLASGPLSTAIQSLWQGKAGLAANNTFTGPQTRQGHDATNAQRAILVDPSFAAFTFATGADVYYVDTPAAHSTWTATTTGAAPGVHIVTCYVLNSNIAKGVSIVRDDASVICTLGGNLSGYCRLLLLDGRWRLIGIGGEAFTIVTPN